MVKLSNAEEAWVVAENELRATKQELADYKQEVSDAMKEYCKGHGIPNYDRFIIPAPKPDPLVEVLKALPVGRVSLETYSRNVRAALDAAGFEIREKSDDQNFNTCNRMR